MAKRELKVFPCGAHVGTLAGSGSLISGFRYRSGYDGPMLSKSKPITARSVGRVLASNRFSGLLPEGEELRRAMAETSGGRDAIQDQALTEHLTLAAARALGIPAAESQFHEFNGVPAVVVRRFDRAWVDETVQRVHQEDFCQAMGFGPDQKYEDQAGRGSLRLLTRITRSRSPRRNRSGSGSRSPQW